MAVSSAAQPPNAQEGSGQNQPAPAAPVAGAGSTPAGGITIEAALAALTLILLAGLPPAVAEAQAAPLMAALGIPTVGVGLVAAHVLLTHEPPGTVAHYMTRTAAARSAAYAIAAGNRIQAGGDPAAERRYLAQHLNAERARAESARRVDTAVRLYGPVLGWHAIRDHRTTQECWDAHGGNFHALRPPAIGYPGTLHGGTCRCLPGPPFAGGGVLV